MGVVVVRKRDQRQLKGQCPCVVCGEPVSEYHVAAFYVEVYGDYELKRFAHVECKRAHPAPPAPMGPPDLELIQLSLFEGL